MRIRFVADAMSPSEAEISDGNLSVLEYLEREHPGGIPVRAYSAETLEEIPPEEWALPELHNDAVIVVMPKGIETAIVVAIIAAVVAVAAMLVISMAMTPGASAIGADPEASPTYSLNLPTNQARLDKTIPVTYGEVTITPDLASQPYREFVNNEEWVYSLLVLGPGEYQLNGVQIEQTEVAGLPSGVFSTRKFAPADHASTMGNIEAAFGVAENVVTSGVVSDAELAAPDEAEVSESQQTRGVDFIAPDTLRVYGPLNGVDINAGSQIEITGSASNDGVFTASGAPVVLPGYSDIAVAEPVVDESGFTTLLNRYAITSKSYGRLKVEWTVQLSRQYDESGWVASSNPDPLPDAMSPGSDLTVDWDGKSAAATVYSTNIYTYSQTVTESSGSGDNNSYTTTYYYAKYTVVVDLQEGVEPTGYNGLVTFTAKGVPVQFAVDLFSSYIRGYYIASPPGAEGEEIALDFVFPGGLYSRNQSTGALADRTIEIEAEWQEVDETGSPVGDPTAQIFTYTRANKTVYRVTEKIAVPLGRYRIRCKRLTATSGDAADQDRVIWAGLKFKVANSATPVYGNVSILATKARATAGLSGSALRQIKADVVRLLPTPGTLTYTPDNLGPYSTIPDVIADILFNPDYGAGYDSGLLDFASFSEIRDALEVNGIPTFNGVVDDARPTFELIREVGAHGMVEAYFRPDGLGLVVDAPRASQSYVFSPANVIEGTFRRSYRTRGAEPYDSIEVGFFDFATRSTEWVRWPAAGAFPRRVDLSRGLTDSAHALGAAKVIHAALPLEDQAVEFETELEGRIVEYLDRIGVAWPLWGARRVARIERSAGLEMLLDRAPEDLAGSVWAMLVADDGTPVGPILGALSGRNLELDVDPGITLHGADSDRVQTPVMLAPTSAVAEDWTITGVEPQDNGRVRITARRYDAARYAGTAWEGMTF